MGLRILRRQPLKGQIRCKRWFARCFWVRIFLFLHWIWKNWSIGRHIISCVLVDREKNLNGKQSEIPVYHPVKRRPFKRVTYKANKTKNKKKRICIFPKANQQTVSPFLWKINREICLTLKIWGLSLFWKSYSIWRPRGRPGFLSLNDGEEPNLKPTRSELAEGESSEDFDNFWPTSNIFWARALCSALD